MTDKEDNPNLEDINPLNSEELKKKSINWNYCPGCGSKLPSIERLKYCIKCGVDLQYIKEHKRLPHSQITYPYSQAGVQPSYSVPYAPQKRYREVLSDEDILYTRDKRLWGNIPSIGFPLLGFIIINGIILGIVIALIFLIDTTILYNIITSPIFMVLATLVTYILFIIPVWYVKKYLQNPNLENRLILLGFTSKGLDQKGVLKEVLIGLVFAFVGIFLVVASSIGIELILKYIFGVRIVREASNDTDVIISGFDIFILIFMIIMMILVVGPSEEILFRGFMQRGLVRNLGEKWGLLITAIIFASIHLVTLIFYILKPIIFIILFVYMFVPYIAISLMLGLMYRWRKENLIAVIVTHGVYNSLTLIIAFLYYVYY
jgi:membrane protease YdiL (CAAX protease family)